MSSQEHANLESHSGKSRRWSALLVDKGQLILFSIVCSAAIGGFFWVMNREIFGDGTGITLVVLLAYAIYSTIRIRRLERKLKELGYSEPLFPPSAEVPGDSPPR